MKSILLVEDTSELAAVIIRELHARGYEVLHAPDGESALDVLRDDARDFDLVILDWMLPGLDGLEVLRRLRGERVTPVLMLTARDEEADRVLGLELGADDYLTKPFSMRELLARVGAIFRRVELIRETMQADASPQRQDVISGDALFLDPASYIARLDGEALDLTRTEFLLLHLLLRNPGRTFTREYIFKMVWQQEYIEGDRAVDNAILRLRKKLGRMGDCIETLWGVGYRWQD